MRTTLMIEPINDCCSAGVEITKPIGAFVFALLVSTGCGEFMI
jgi:hypothetical protein